MKILARDGLARGGPPCLEPGEAAAPSAASVFCDSRRPPDRAVGGTVRSSKSADLRAEAVGRREAIARRPSRASRARPGGHRRRCRDNQRSGILECILVTAFRPLPSLTEEVVARPPCRRSCDRSVRHTQTRLALPGETSGARTPPSTQHSRLPADHGSVAVASDLASTTASRISLRRIASWTNRRGGLTRSSSRRLSSFAGLAGEVGERRHRFVETVFRLGVVGTRRVQRGISRGVGLRWNRIVTSSMNSARGR